MGTLAVPWHWRLMRPPHLWEITSIHRALFWYILEMCRIYLTDGYGIVFLSSHIPNKEDHNLQQGKPGLRSKKSHLLDSFGKIRIVSQEKGLGGKGFRVLWSVTLVKGVLDHRRNSWEGAVPKSLNKKATTHLEKSSKNKKFHKCSLIHLVNLYLPKIF